MAREKQTLQRYFRGINKPRLFVYLSFTAIILILLKNILKNNCQIVIDQEYPGHEKVISDKLRELILENTKIKDFRIYTTQIGKKSNAHSLAYSVFKKRGRDRIRKIKAKEIIRIINRNLKSGSA